MTQAQPLSNHDTDKHTSSLVFRIDDLGVATLSLNRPEAGNAFNDDLIKALLDKLAEVEANDQINCLLLRSEGKHFCAGADLNWMKAMAGFDYARNLADAHMLSALMDKLYRLSKPTIACVQGSAFGGAIGLIACCDIAIAASNAQFCLSEVKLGLAPAVISPYVIAAMGSRQARRYFLTAEVFNSDMALRMGLLHEVVGMDALQETAISLAQQISQHSQKAIMATKALIRRVDGEFPDADLRVHTVQLIAKLRVSEDAQEGIRAFFEKRQPNWS
jgi:methylglutaconyl-CoA hydratase